MRLDLAERGTVPEAAFNNQDDDVTSIYERCHMFEEKREMLMATEAAVLPLMPHA
jgi:hypothetical protein